MAESIYSPSKGTLASQLRGVKGFFRTLTAERRQKALDDDYKRAERQRLQQLKNRAKRRKGEAGR